LYVIQNINNEKYIKHDGSPDGTDFPYDYVDSPEQAEQYKSYEHAEYVAFWYVDMSQKWRVIDLITNQSYVKGKGSAFVKE